MEYSFLIPFLFSLRFYSGYLTVIRRNKAVRDASKSYSLGNEHFHLVRKEYTGKL